MKNHPVIMGALIALLLAVNGGLLYWAIQGQAEKLQKEEMVAAAAAGEDITGAVTALCDVTAQAKDKMVKELAAEHVYAHRGNLGARLEHSFESYDQAIADGARYIEPDVVVSKNGTLYVSHDQDAYQMTGTNKAYSSMTDAEIDALRTHAGNPILRLSDLFDRYGTSVRYVVELKSKDQATNDAFVRLIDQYGFQDRVTAECFHLDNLKYLEEVYPDMPKLYLCEQSAYLDQGYEAPYVDIISVEASMLTEDRVKRAHELGKQFNIWPLTDRGVVFSEDELRRAIDLGVDSYFTDDVKMAISLEETYGFKKRYEK